MRRTYGHLQPLPVGQPRRDGRRKGATRAMGVFCRMARGLQNLTISQQRTEQIAANGAFGMAAFQQHRRRSQCQQRVGLRFHLLNSLSRLLPQQPRRFGQVWRHQTGQREQLRHHGLHCGWLQQDPARCGNHHRVQHYGNVATL